MQFYAFSPTFFLPEPVGAGSNVYIEVCTKLKQTDLSNAPKLLQAIRLFEKSNGLTQKNWVVSNCSVALVFIACLENCEHIRQQFLIDTDSNFVVLVISIIYNTLARAWWIISHLFWWILMRNFTLYFNYEYD